MGTTGPSASDQLFIASVHGPMTSMISPRDDSPSILTNMTNIGSDYQSVLDSVMTKTAPKVKSGNSTNPAYDLYPSPKSKVEGGSSYYRTLSFEASPRRSLHEASGDTSRFPSVTANIMATAQDGSTCVHICRDNICTCPAFLLHGNFNAMIHNASIVQGKYSSHYTGPHDCRTAPRY